jgi:hypothetical protein
MICCAHCLRLACHTTLVHFSFRDLTVCRADSYSNFIEKRGEASSRLSKNSLRDAHDLDQDVHDSGLVDPDRTILLLSCIKPSTTNTKTDIATDSVFSEILSYNITRLASPQRTSNRTRRESARYSDRQFDCDSRQQLTFLSDISCWLSSISLTSNDTSYVAGCTSLRESE